MEEIRVGEYVRTKKGIARIVEDGRFVEIRENGNRMYYVDTNGTPCTWEFSCYIWSKDIVKHSKNILDLIEVGDYVNGKLVSNVDKVDNTNFIEWDDGDMYKTEIQNDKFVKSIVTHQQFASMKYRVED